MPVVRYAEGLSLAEIAEEEKLLTDKARSNKLTLEDIEGETIALSNLGAYDIDSFLGIVPPQVSTIVSAGKVAQTAVPMERPHHRPQDGQPVAGRGSPGRSLRLRRPVPPVPGGATGGSRAVDLRRAVRRGGYSSALHATAIVAMSACP